MSFPAGEITDDGRWTVIIYGRNEKNQLCRLQTYKGLDNFSKEQSLQRAMNDVGNHLIIAAKRWTNNEGWTREVVEEYKK